MQILYKVGRFYYQHPGERATPNSVEPRHPIGGWMKIRPTKVWRPKRMIAERSVLFLGMQAWGLKSPTYNNGGYRPGRTVLANGIEEVVGLGG